METAEQLMERGDFVEALRVLDGERRRGDLPAHRYMMLFNLRTRLEEYPGALAALRDVVRVDPKYAEVIHPIVECALAEQLRTARKTDAALAGKWSTAGIPFPPSSRGFMQAAVLHAQSRHAEAAQVLAEAVKAAPAVPGTLVSTSGAEMRFSDLTDTDDLTGPHLSCFFKDVLLDVPFSALREVQFEPPRFWADFLWRPALLVLRNGEEQSVNVFSLYAGTGLHREASVRLGQMTVWRRRNGYAEGAGQRDLRLTNPGGGAAMVGILQVARIVFDDPVDA